jgi:hypothetical protein
MPAALRATSLDSLTHGRALSVSGQPFYTADVGQGDVQ